MYRTVFAFLVLALAAAVATPRRGCSTPLSVEEFEDLYCNSTLVFKGRRTYSSSSVSRDRIGRWIIFGYSDFDADQVFKGSPEDPHDISVDRIWSQAEHRGQCRRHAFPDRADTFLVFASGTGPYQVETCRHSFPWDNCVPESFKSSLPLDC
ncbi:hypothetical protein PoB_005197500 [Plakobranchus ocellatus]|uniref:Uncharacterized protein n=1 Tax=Plakobranchus ocellatus TaxID=259542 RepID=A0AAV4C247_9GAST|nr:hypothetical protein PoB_005197500 [Plakobranchus ocellatus]